MNSMTDRCNYLEERLKQLEQAVNSLYREQIKARGKLIGFLEYVVERLQVPGLKWDDIAAIHKEIKDSFDEALEKVKEEIREEEKVERLINSVFKKKSSLFSMPIF
ncbi:MAG: hypothetical protein JW928_07095 [Candidatus Aureabacteria bacterium]|nr:hypothetical protein [Candidatus Auribacterota bacterium]